MGFSDCFTVSFYSFVGIHASLVAIYYPFSQSDVIGSRSGLFLKYLKTGNLGSFRYRSRLGAILVLNVG